MQYIQGQIRDFTAQVLVLMRVTHASGVSHNHLSSRLRAPELQSYKGARDNKELENTLRIGIILQRDPTQIKNFQGVVSNDVSHPSCKTMVVHMVGRNIGKP